MRQVSRARPSSSSTTRIVSPLASAPSTPSSALGSSGAAASVAGQQHLDRRALARGRVDLDRAAGLRDDAVDSREAEAGSLALRLRRVERLEGALDARRASCRSRCRARAGARRARRPASSTFAQLDRELAAGGHRVARVHREVHEHLLDLGRVGLDSPRAARSTSVLSSTSSPSVRPSSEVSRSSTSATSTRAGRTTLVAAEHEQLAREPGRALGGLLDLLGVGAQRASSSRPSTGNAHSRGSPTGSC